MAEQDVAIEGTIRACQRALRKGPGIEGMSAPPTVAMAALFVCTLLAATGCGESAGEGDCTQALRFRDETYLSYASSDLGVADRDLGPGDLVACADDGGASQEGDRVESVRVHSIDDQDSAQVVGVEIEGRLDLYFRDGMDSKEIDRLIEDLT
ncbi:DUF6281 family protein [Nocardioides sp. CPCC 206347]|uniref:DUF6281 family protein n=2 Tax=Nocardioides TaxID=1839 RepID=UPI003B429C8B